MTHDHEPTVTHERETVIVDKGGSGSGTGAILAVVGVLVLLAVVWYFAIGPGASPSTTNNTNNNTVNPPAASQPAAEESAAP